MDLKNGDGGICDCLCLYFEVSISMASEEDLHSLPKRERWFWKEEIFLIGDGTREVFLLLC